MQLHTLRYPVKGASQFTLSIVKDAHHHQGNKDGGMSAHRARLICLLALDCLLILFTVVLVSARHFLAARIFILLVVFFLSGEHWLFRF